MTISRRRLLVLAGAVGFARPAWALDYPAKPVHLIVGYAPGGATDITARLIGQFLSERLGQQFIIEDRPGAATNLATEVVVNAAPDGYTLLLVGASGAINATLYDRLGFNFIHDIAPVAGIIRVPSVLAVNPAFPVKSVPELISYAKVNPGKINMASGGAGSAPHMAGEYFKLMAGINMLHVPYRGEAPALTDLLAGQVQVCFPTLPASLEYVRSGKLRGLAVTSAEPVEALPDVPPIADFLPGYEASFWYGLGAPANTPAAVIDTLSRAVGAALADPAIKRRFAELGGTVMPLSPAAFAKLIADETEKWAKVIRAANLKAD